MSKSREIFAVEIIDLLSRHIWTVCGINIVRDAASAGVTHQRLTILFRHSQDVEIGRKSVPEGVGRHLVLYAEILAKPLQPFPEAFEIEVENFSGKRAHQLDYLRRHLHPAHGSAVFGAFYLDVARADILAVDPSELSGASSGHEVEQHSSGERIIPERCQDLALLFDSERGEAMDAAADELDEVSGEVTDLSERLEEIINS